MLTFYTTHDIIESINIIQRIILYRTLETFLSNGESRSAQRGKSISALCALTESQRLAGMLRKVPFGILCFAGM